MRPRASPAAPGRSSSVTVKSMAMARLLVRFRASYVRSRRLSTSRRRSLRQPAGQVLDTHDPDAVAAMGIVVPQREAEHRRDPAAHLSVEAGGVAAGATEVLTAVRPVSQRDEVGAG